MFMFTSISMRQRMSLLTDLYTDIPSSLRKWIFVALVMFIVGMLSAWTINVNRLVDEHVAIVEQNTRDIVVLEQRTDSIVYESQNNWKKIERYLCYNNREAAILAGYNCPAK